MQSVCHTRQGGPATGLWVSGGAGGAGRSVTSTTNTLRFGGANVSNGHSVTVTIQRGTKKKTVAADTELLGWGPQRTLARSVSARPRGAGGGRVGRVRRLHICFCQNGKTLSSDSQGLPLFNRMPSWMFPHASHSGHGRQPTLHWIIRVRDGLYYEKGFLSEEKGVRPGRWGPLLCRRKAGRGWGLQPVWAEGPAGH